MSENTVTETAVVYPPLTPYGLAKVLTEATGTKVEPQQFYSLHKRGGTIETTTVPGSDKKYFDGDSAHKYIVEYVKGNRQSAGRLDYAALAEMFTADVDEVDTDDAELAEMVAEDEADARSTEDVAAKETDEVAE
jgi:hypothetical protein